MEYLWMNVRKIVGIISLYHVANVTVHFTHPCVFVTDNFTLTPCSIHIIH